VGIVGTAGCLRLGGDSNETPTETGTQTPTETGEPETEEEATDTTTGQYSISPSGGEAFCVTAVETDESVTEFYGYDTDDNDSRGGETGFEKADTASLFLHRDTTTDTLSLVFLHGSSDESNLRRADYALTGFDGVSWLVKDDPGSYEYDSYSSSNGALTEVNWRWEGGTDGGAVGPLGEEFDLTVLATTQEVSTWRVIDGDGSVAGTIPVEGSVQITGGTGSICG
jgi:hypothetical protein